ncbi:hypothetical protein [Streptomyces sp. NPDC088755]|uniref:hypothetical protein n=1 Tax=Streptomyces sp. NPDC088755 TaxID=3365888 RepID=UPI0037F93681
MTATQSPPPATATEVLPSPCPMVATAQASAVAGCGTAISQMSAAAVESRPMRDPYTTGSLIHAVRRHA